MTTKKSESGQVKTAKKLKAEPGVLQLTGVETLPKKAKIEKSASRKFKHRYTTGPFLLPQNAGSLDWTVLNNSARAQTMRVTVYRCPVGAVKIAMPPGPLVVTLDPGESSHNANTYAQGFAYEVLIECNSRRIFPYVSVWPGNWGVVIPGAGINSGMFLRRLP